MEAFGAMRPWVIGGGIGVLGVLGLMASAHSGDGSARTMGMLLFVFCSLYILLMVKDAYDRAEGYGGLDPAVLASHEARWAELKAGLGVWLLGAGATILGIAGLFGAAQAHGAGQAMGLGLFVLAVALDFVLIKHSFDKAERS